MLDDLATQTMPTWAQTLSVGDIVLCRVPYFDTGDGHTPIPRPCLVADIATVAGAMFVELAPATRTEDRIAADADIVADASAFCPPWGEDAPWRFRMNSTQRFDLAHASFVTPPHDTSPVIGRLYGAALDHLEVLRGQRQASRERHLAEKRNRRPQKRAR